jgi:DNA-binding NarL/FixJ family response regulator
MPKEVRKRIYTEEEVKPFEDKIRRERWVVLMLAAQGMTDGQIANHLHIPQGTVKSRLNRGRNELNELLMTEWVNSTEPPIDGLVM